MIELIVITANLKCAHWHWHNPWWHVGTYILSLKAKLYPTNRELTIISTSCHIRHRLIIHGKTGENKFVNSFEVWYSWTTIISLDSDLFAIVYYHSLSKTRHFYFYFMNRSSLIRGGWGYIIVVYLNNFKAVHLTLVLY